VQRPDYDAVVVGSGFGGSVVANRLATDRDPWKVLLLERGRQHAPAAFPRTPAQVKRSFWDPSHALYGLFDVWSFSGLAAVVASGLGGGSLIYANVLERVPDGWMRYEHPDDGSRRLWPIDAAALAPHYRAVEAKLAPTPYPDVEPFGSTAKTRAFRSAAEQVGLTEHPPKLAVQFEDDDGTIGTRLPFGRPDDNLHRAQRFTCDMLGECDLGCRLGAKHSLDLTYLSEIRAPSEIRTRAEVIAFRPVDIGFEIEYLDHHREDPKTPPTRTTVTAGTLVLAAGTLGTALLMLRNRLALPGVSPHLGRQFCGNGDYLAFAAGCKPVANGATQPIDASRGPVITASARARDWDEGGDGPGFHIQDGGFPEWASWLAQLAGVRRDIARVRVQAQSIVRGRLRGDPEDNLSTELSGLIDDGGVNLLPILSLGRDIPAGRLHLRNRRIDVEWRKDQSAALYERTETASRRLAAALGGRYVDPLRVLQPITVHPLGGCAMSGDHRTGVVDEYGMVHGVPHLSIADGSILPGPVGINPALTIAALADRQAERLICEGRRG
jgi:cholesterol oxidase